LAALGDNVNSVVLDVFKDADVLSKLIGEHDLCISLLPFKLHTLVAKLCIRQKTDMVTTSYITPELQQLDDALV
jgi:saccharopine dehydrogenase-like NADP-dependent oxidoreductase